jgi:hypothetical protein
VFHPVICHITVKQITNPKEKIAHFPQSEQNTGVKNPIIRPIARASRKPASNIRNPPLHKKEVKYQYYRKHRYTKVHNCEYEFNSFFEYMRKHHKDKKT